MQLLASWRDSLTIFKWSNFKLFLLVTLKALVETYKVWFKYWWWLIIAMIGINFLVWQGRLLLFDFLAMGPYTTDFVVVGFHDHMKQSLVALPIIVLFFITLFLSIRPSLARKDMHYFAGFIKQYVWLVVWFLSFPLLWIELIGFLEHVGFSIPPLQFGLFVYTSLLFSILFIFFLNDSDGSIQSFFMAIGNAGKMLLFNAPFYIISMALIFGLWALIGGLFLIMGFLFFKVVGSHELMIAMAIIFFLEILIFLPLIITVMNNFYIKRLHEQFTLYFKA